MNENTNEDKLKTNLVGFDDFLEDLFGLNLRGLRTLRTSFFAPKKIL